MRKTSLLVLGVLVLGPGFSTAVWAGEPIRGVDENLGSNGGLYSSSVRALFASPVVRAFSQIVRTGAALERKKSAIFGEAVTFTATVSVTPVNDAPSIVIGFAPLRPAEFLAAPVSGVDDPTADGNQALRGDPIPGVDVKLGKDPGGIILAAADTNADGFYAFTGIASGDYVLTVGGQRVIGLTVGPDGLVQGSSIFDRWGNAVAQPRTAAAAGALRGTIYISTAGGGVWKSLRTRGRYSAATVRGLANVQGDLAGASAAFATGRYGEAYELARAAEVTVADLDSDGPEQIAAPKPAPSRPTIIPNPTPVNDAPKAAPSSPASVPDPTPINDPPNAATPPPREPVSTPAPEVKR